LALNKKISLMARQVAHDIRGPLTALNTLGRLSHEMGPEKKELLLLAVGRINGIAEDLLRKGEGADVEEAPEVVSSSAGAELFSAISSLVKEYRFAHPQVQLTFQNHTGSENLPIFLERIKVQRILSNILNNAIEACSLGEAVVTVTLLDRPDHWVIQVMDNGCGIPEEFLSRLGQEGASFGKTSGNGLGIFDAQQALKACGGDLQIHSRVGVGTQVILMLPKESAAYGLSS
jgi:signal transduction histidine kinase